MNNNDCYHVKMAAFHELQEALNIIRAFVIECTLACQLCKEKQYYLT